MRHKNTRIGVAPTKAAGGDTISIFSGSGYVGSVYKTKIVTGGNWQADGVDISGETGTSYTMTVASEGKAISFKPTGAPAGNKIEMLMPSDIANLTLWIDAYYTTGITFGTGSLVSGIASRLGSLAYAQATAGNQLSHSMTGRNSKPAFVMATGKVMTLNTPASLPGGTNPSTTIALAYASAVGTNYRAFIGWGSGTGVGSYRMLGKNNSGNRCLLLGAAELLSPSLVTFINEDRILAGIVKSGGQELVVDGEHETTDALTANTGTISSCSLGVPSPGYARQWEGSMQETVVYSAALGDADREKVEGYIAHRWDQAARLPVGHPYKIAAPRLQ